jgi:hypothetical protein
LPSSTGVAGLVPAFEDLVHRHLPDWRAFNIVLRRAQLPLAALRVVYH